METLKSNKARLEYLINDMRRERNDNDVLVMPSSLKICGNYIEAWQMSDRHYL